MLKKILFFQIAFILTGLAALSFEESDIDYLENMTYGRLYSEESLGERLNRLENDMTGMSQSGDLDTRINNLLIIKGNPYAINNPYPVSDFSSEKTTKPGAIRRFFNGLSDTFSSGTVTGFTPPLSSSIYQNGYSSYGNYSYGAYPYSSARGLFDYSPAYCNFYGNQHHNHPNNFNNGFNHPINSLNRYHNHARLHSSARYHHPNNGFGYYPGNYNVTRAGYYPQNGYGFYNPSVPYVPSNVISRSSVHILRD